MSKETLYIIIKISNILMGVFQYIFISGFFVITLMQIFNKNHEEKISTSRLIKELVYGFIVLILFFINSSFSFFHPLVMWTCVLGILIGVLQSFSIQFLRIENGIKACGRHLYAIIWGFSILFTEVALLYLNGLMSIGLVAVVLGVSILLGMNIILIVKLNNFKKFN